MTMGKSFDTHGPIGPWLVTADEIGDPHALALRTWVNGELRQDAQHRRDDLRLLRAGRAPLDAFTLEPGDVIATGTPAGVGVARQPVPEVLLQAGDTVRVEIDGIGELKNTVVEEPEGFVAGE